MKTFLLFILFPLSLFALENPELISHAEKRLAHYGVLQKKETGFTYLKVDDAYIHTLYEFLEEEGFEKPPYFRRADAPGAHISVLYEKEGESLRGVPRIGEVFSFTIKQLTKIRTRDKEYIILQVHAPELEKYRVSLGFTPRLQNHDFHISLAVRKLSKKPVPTLSQEHKDWH